MPYQEQTIRRRKQNPCQCSYRGVTWYDRTNKWQAIITADGFSKHLGYFRNPIEAARAYDRAAAYINGPDTNLNFPGLPIGNVKVSHV